MSSEGVGGGTAPRHVTCAKVIQLGKVKGQWVSSTHGFKAPNVFTYFKNYQDGALSWPMNHFSKTPLSRWVFDSAT